MLTFSVALCSYNGAKFILEQLDSIAAQTRTPDELVICDDGSCDATIAEVANFASRASFPVRVHVNEAVLGPTKNFERAIALSGGDVIALCDQDDVWHSDKLARFEALFAASPSLGAVFTDAEVVDEQLKPLGYRLWKRYGFGPARQRRLLEGRAFEVLLDKNAVTGATLAFRSWLKRWVVPIPPGWMHDAWIAVVTAAVSDLSLVEEPLILYRQHAHNLIGGRMPPFSEFLREALRDNSQFYVDYVEQLKFLRRRLAQCPRLKRADCIARLDSRILHFQNRARMPERRLKRLRFVMQELCTLRYFRFSKGGISMAKDLFLSRN